MPIHVALSHRTRYRYDRLVALSPHTIRLRPAPHCRTPILSYSLKVVPQRALHQLAAGPLRQLSRAARVPRPDATAADRRRPDRRAVGLQSVRLLSRTVGRNVSVRLRALAEPGARAVPRAAPGRPEAPRLVWARSIGAGSAPSISSSISTAGWHRTSPTSFGSSQASRRPKRRSPADAARAATPAGCSCRSCGISVWRRASSPAT